jgi:hypothetical protein
MLKRNYASSKCDGSPISCMHGGISRSEPDQARSGREDLEMRYEIESPMLRERDIIKGQIWSG